VAGREVFQRGTDDPHQIVSLMPIKFCVLDGDYCVDEIARQLIVRHCVPVLDVDLAEYLALSIENHARRFHLFELVQIKCLGLGFQAGEKN